MKGTHRRLIVAVQRRGGQDRDKQVIAHTERILSKMVSARLLNTLRITIKLRATTIDEAALGLCHWRDRSKGSTARSKHYTIEIRRDLPTSQLLRTLTHELAHVEQMARGKLTVRKTYGVLGWFWRDGAGAATKYTLDVPWHKRPWEIEARQMEDKYNGKFHAPRRAA